MYIICTMSINKRLILEENDNIGKKLKELRKAEGLTQAQLIEKLHIDRVNYTRYETDASRPDYETLIAIADFYEVSLDELFNRKPYSN